MPRIKRRTRKRRAEGQRETEWARREYRTHVMREGDVRSYRFRRANGDSNHWFSLTWTPGHLALAGDVGELTLVHYSALREFEEGIRWAASSDHDYLMGKTNVRQEYSREDTVDFIVQWANEEAVRALDGSRYKHWRKNPETGEMEPIVIRHKGYRHELQAYRRALTKAKADFEAARAAGEDPDWFDYAPDDPRGTSEDLFTFPKKPGWEAEVKLLGGNVSLDTVYDIPECWWAWCRIWRHLRGSYHNPLFDQEGPEFVLKAANRRILKDEIEDLCDSRDDAVRFCQSVGLEDYYGSERWPPRTYWQIEAIRHGCNLILDALDPKRTWGREWGDPVI